MTEVPSWLWIVLTIVAAGSQTLRNAMQRGLTEALGTVAATLVRFLFGLPFVVGAAAALMIATGRWLPVPSGEALAWTTLGAVAQIGGTALLLAAMRERSFLVAIAYTKVEPVLVALFGLIVLGETLTPWIVVAIVTATVGVMVMSWPKREAVGTLSWTSIALGLGSATLFSIATIGYRGGVLALPDVGFVARAMTMLLVAITIQTALLTGYLLVRQRARLVAMMQAWRPSLLAGLLGAFASLLWFACFAIEQPAKVRTLALVEILFAQAITQRFLREAISGREAAGIALMIGGVLLLLNAPAG